MESAACLAAELDARLLRLCWLVGGDAGRDRGRTAGSALATLRDGGPRRITDLAAGEAIAQPSLTKPVGRLVPARRTAAMRAPWPCTSLTRAASASLPCARAGRPWCRSDCRR